MALLTKVCVLFLAAYATALPKIEHRAESSSPDLSSYFSNDQLREFLKRTPLNFAAGAQADEMGDSSSPSSNNYQPPDWNAYMKACMSQYSVPSGQSSSDSTSNQENGSGWMGQLNQYTGNTDYTSQIKKQQEAMEKCRKQFEAGSQQYQSAYQQYVPQGATSQGS